MITRVTIARNHGENNWRVVHGPDKDVMDQRAWLRKLRLAGKHETIAEAIILKPARRVALRHAKSRAPKAIEALKPAPKAPTAPPAQPSPVDKPKVAEATTKPASEVPGSESAKKHATAARFGWSGKKGA